MAQITVTSPTTGQTRQIEETITQQGKQFKYAFTKAQKNYAVETDMYEYKEGSRTEWIGTMQPFAMTQDSTGT